MKKNHNIVEVTAELLQESKLAFRLDDGKTKDWVPKSQVEDNCDGTFSMPEWLARDKGFI